jgi:hypothetical protein
LPRINRWFTFALLAGVFACADSSSGVDETGVPEQQLQFLRFTSSSAVTVRTASFWAVKGQARKLELRYAPTQPGQPGERFLEFEVQGNSLLTKPGGGLFLPGDSVRITVTLDNSDRFIMHFEPSGIIFNPLDPARLRISYLKADRDIDHDGDTDDRDRTLELALKVWKQELPGLPWLPQLSVRIDDDEIEARILSFTGFAMASN